MRRYGGGGVRTVGLPSGDAPVGHLLLHAG